jgi:thiopeptide-type bacteriocin biosynthesis protein
MTRSWISIHIFYSIDQNPLLVECIGPMMSELCTQGLVQRYFFIRYWENGPHIRLRLLPQPGADEALIKSIMTDRLEDFLARKPVFFKMPGQVGPSWRKWFILEYGEDVFRTKYGPSGVIPQYPDNTFRFIDYIPEWDRYGGEQGVDLAERHFHQSSLTVLERLEGPNMHIRTVQVAQALKLMLGLSFAFLETQEAVSQFALDYATYWYRVFFEGKEDLGTKITPTAQRLLPRLRRHIRAFADDIQGNTHLILTPADIEWIDHARQIKAELTGLLPGLLQNGKLKVRIGDDSPFEVDSQRFLLTSYVHMTNNRIGASLYDEVNMCYLVFHALSNVADKQVA